VEDVRQIPVQHLVDGVHDPDRVGQELPPPLDLLDDGENPAVEGPAVFAPPGQGRPLQP